MEAQQVIEAIASGRVEELHRAFTRSLADEVSPRGITSVWRDAVAQLGSFLGDEEPVVLYDLPLRFERGHAHLQIVYRCGEIAGLVLKPGVPTAKFGQ